MPVRCMLRSVQRFQTQKRTEKDELCAFSLLMRTK